MDEAVRRGVVRYVYLIIDQSRAMIEKDLKPSRLEATRRIAQVCYRCVC